jgi:predicted permease
MEAVFAAVVPVMLTILLGYGMARAGRPVQSELIRFLVVQVGSPTLIFTALLATDLSGRMLLGLAAATVMALVVFAMLGWLLLRLTGWPVRAFLPSLMFSNSGNLGLPLALYAYGPLGLGYAAVINTINLIGNFTVGQSIAVGRADWRTVLRSPSMFAAAIGLVVASLHLHLPAWLKNTLQLPAQLTIPLLLLMLGTSLATIRITSLGRTLTLATMRIAMGAATGFALAAAFQLTGVPRAVLVLQLAMPAAVYNYLFALAGKTDPEGVASVVVASTLMAALVIPLLLAVLG